MTALLPLPTPSWALVPAQPPPGALDCPQIHTTQPGLEGKAGRGPRQGSSAAAHEGELCTCGFRCSWSPASPEKGLGAGRGSSGEVVGNEPEGVPSQFRERWCGVDEASEDTVETVERQRTQSKEAGQPGPSPVRPPAVCSQSLRSYTGSTRGHSSWTGSSRACSSWIGSRMIHSLRSSYRAYSSWTGSRMTHSLRSSSRAYSSCTGSSHKNHSPPWSPHRSHSPPWTPHRRHRPPWTPHRRHSLSWSPHKSHSPLCHSWSRNRLAHSSTRACSSRRAHSSWSHSPHSRSHSPHSPHSRSHSPHSLHSRSHSPHSLHSRSHSPHSPHSRSHGLHSQSHSLRSSHSSPWFWWIEGGAGRGAGEREVQVWSPLSPGSLYPCPGSGLSDHSGGRADRYSTGCLLELEFQIIEGYLSRKEIQALQGADTASALGRDPDLIVSCSGSSCRRTVSL
nr:serine/arginine repetitive matrix protein 2-like [Gorilla gorilla gorilla]